MTTLRSSLFLALAASAFVPVPALAQGAPPSSVTEADPDEGRSGDSDVDEDEEGYEIGREDAPGTIDPFEHTAYMEVGFHREESSVSGTTRLFPLRWGFAYPLEEHLQIEGAFGLAGMVTESIGVLGGGNNRTFHPGNLALGGYYTLGGTEDDILFAAGAGGQLVFPTSQNPDLDQEIAHFGAQAVHGLVDRWLYLPETMSIVPGVYGRFAYRFIFANLDMDLGFGISTDDADPTHSFQLRVEGGLRMDDNWRLGLGLTEVKIFGPGFGASDSNQAALRVFFRADIKFLTIGCELVMNLDDPLGFAFDDGGIWGLVSQVGLSL